MINSSIVYYSIIIIVVIIVDILCDNTRNLTFGTPWPTLGRREYNIPATYSVIWGPHTTAKPYFVRNSTKNHFAGRKTPIPANRTEFPNEDDELRHFSEELLNKDSNNAAQYVKINLQSKTTSRSMQDVAPLPLLHIEMQAFQVPSIEKLRVLYNNYIVESNMNEIYTPEEKNEENQLLDYVINTPVMQLCREFLIKNHKIGPDVQEFKNTLQNIWFNMYARGGARAIGSSGFEHVFLAEIKNNQVSGLHNWLYFGEVETKNQLNYLGYLKNIDLGNKGAILKLHFNYRGIDKPVGSMFIGTSPELEMALYTTCFLMRADRICPLKMNGNRFIIRTYTYRYRGKSMIGSAFPEI